MENWIQWMELQQEHSTNIANMIQRLLYSRNCPATVGSSAFIVVSAALRYSGPDPVYS